MLEICRSCKIMWKKKKSAWNHVVWSSHKIKLSTLQTRHYSRAECAERLQVFTHRATILLHDMQKLCKFNEWLWESFIRRCARCREATNKARGRKLGSHQYRTLRWKHIQKALWSFLTLQPSSCPRADEEVEDSQGNGDTECRYRVVFTGRGWKYLPFIATSKHTDEHYSHKNTGRRHKKKRKKISGLSLCSASWDVCHFLFHISCGEIFPWWEGQRHSIWNQVHQGFPPLSSIGVSLLMFGFLSRTSR